jgi:hypothetical protein
VVAQSGRGAHTEDVASLAIISAIGMPLLMGAGAVAAWMQTRKGDARPAVKPEWRDTSLDDWRQERDAAAEAERLQRASDERAGTATGDEARQERETHQRLGG